MSETHRCKGCGREVIFARDPQGTMQILDLKAPVYDVRPNTGKGWNCIRSVEGYYVSHFSTCPKASEFSKKTKKAKETTP